MKKITLILMAIVLCAGLDARTFKAESPDGSYIVTFSDNDGAIRYSISWMGKQVISPSGLGISLGRPMLEGAGIEDLVLTGSEDSTWEPVYGERSHIRDRYNAYRLTFSRNLPVCLEIRAYEEGIAFRYAFTDGRYLKITDENTEFALPEGSMAFFTSRAQTPHVLMPLSGWPDDGQSDRPLLLKLPDGGFVCLAEARVVDYVRTKFSLSDKPNTITTAMYGPVEDIAPYQTPWRLVMCGEKAGDILQNNSIFYNLNDECRIEDTSWIKPGKVMRDITLSTEGGMALVDFAVKRNIQYIHFDAGWYGPEGSRSSDATTVTLDPARNPKVDALDLHKVISYARSKGIGVLLYVNQRALQQQLDEILPLYKEWGVSGIKFGFVQVGSQVWTKWLHEAVAKCAEYGLMVDIHDEYRPTGVSRTYPNLMTQEGVRGNEEFPDGFNNTVLPFTRFVCGPADYTFCYYYQEFDRLDSSKPEYPEPVGKRSLKTTPAHQLALPVIYYSPFQFMYWYDRPSDSQDEPELKFFDDVYTVWDDTRVIDGEPGEFATIARRHADEWFVGTIANGARKTEIALDFLEPGNYVAEVYTDGDNSIQTRTKVRVSKFRVSDSSVLRFNVRRNGGAAVRIVPEQIPDRGLKNWNNRKNSL